MCICNVGIRKREMRFHVPVEMNFYSNLWNLWVWLNRIFCIMWCHAAVWHTARPRLWYIYDLFLAEHCNYRKEKEEKKVSICSGSQWHIVSSNIGRLWWHWRRIAICPEKVSNLAKSTCDHRHEWQAVTGGWKMKHGKHFEWQKRVCVVWLDTILRYVLYMHIQPFVARRTAFPIQKNWNTCRTRVKRSRTNI